MPLTSSSVPTIAALRHSTSVGRARPRSLSHAISTKPATKNREPIWKNGGKLSSANLIARYVEPQISHVAARHAMSSGDSGTRRSPEDAVSLLPTPLHQYNRGNVFSSLAHGNADLSDFRDQVRARRPQGLGKFRRRRPARGL